MHKRLLLLIPLLLVLSPAARAQNNAAPHIGKVDVRFDEASLTPGAYHLTGHVVMTSDDYDLTAEDVKIVSSPASNTKKAASSIRQATATGTPAKQVVAHIRRPLESETYEIYADRAVYQPDSSRPAGGSLTFTGNVKEVIKSGFFAEPSIGTFDHATVLLGPGRDYPQVQTGAGHITLTPAQ